MRGGRLSHCALPHNPRATKGNEHSAKIHTAPQTNTAAASVASERKHHGKYLRQRITQTNQNRPHNYGVRTIMVRTNAHVIAQTQENKRFSNNNSPPRRHATTPPRRHDPIHDGAERLRATHRSRSGRVLSSFRIAPIVTGGAGGARTCMEWMPIRHKHTTKHNVPTTCTPQSIVNSGDGGI